MVVQAGLTLITQALSLFGERGKAAKAEAEKRIASMGRTWTDEFIVIVFFAPLVIAWFSPERSNAWIANLEAMPEWYVALLIAIVSAVFGLGKIKGYRKGS